MGDPIRNILISICKHIDIYVYSLWPLSIFQIDKNHNHLVEKHEMLEAIGHAEKADPGLAKKLQVPPVLTHRNFNTSLTWP